MIKLTSYFKREWLSQSSQTPYHFLENVEGIKYEVTEHKAEKKLMGRQSFFFKLKKYDDVISHQIF